MHLGAAHNHVLINLTAGQEGGKTAPADHVGRRIPPAVQVGNHHLGNQALQGAEMMALVVQALYIGLAAQFPAGTEFIVRILLTE